MTSRLIAFILIVWIFEFGVARAADITVRLLYLKNGKPAQGQQMILFEGDPKQASTMKLTGTTSTDGVTIFHLSEPLPKTLWLYEENGRIEGCAWENQLPLEDVMKQGVTIGVDERFGASCKGDRGVIKQLAAKPGEIVMFVRKRTIWDNLRDY